MSGYNFPSKNEDNESSHNFILDPQKASVSSMTVESGFGAEFYVPSCLTLKSTLQKQSTES